MLIERNNIRSHLPWILVLALGTVGSVAYYLSALAEKGSLPGGSSTPGLLFGIVGGGIMLFELMLWPRKARPWRWGSARAWMRAHIWLGFLSVPLLVMHSGFRMGGQLSSVLMALFLVVILSGVLGLLLQQWLPRVMLTSIPDETLNLQLDDAAQLLASEAEYLVRSATTDEIVALRSTEESQRSGPVVGAQRRSTRFFEIPYPPPRIAEASLMLDTFYDVIHPYLLEGHLKGSTLADPTLAAKTFANLRHRLGTDASELLRILEDCCEKRRQFDRQVRVHWWLHSWLAIHLPISVAMVLLMLVHAWFALKYL